MEAEAEERSTVVRTRFPYMRSVVIKLGTSVVTNNDGSLSVARISSIVEQVSQLRKSGVEVLLVTSGAIGSGQLKLQSEAVLNSTVTLKSWIRDPEGLTAEDDHSVEVDQKASAAVGQAALMRLYEQLFSCYGLACAQILVTESDWELPQQLAQIRSTLKDLSNLGVIPVINENDAISGRDTPVYKRQDQLSSTPLILWDNDPLAALVAVEVQADLLLILGDTDGVLVKSAQESSSVVGCYQEDAQYQVVGGSRMALEAFELQIQAAKNAVQQGVRATVIANGLEPNIISRLISGSNIGTIFLNQFCGHKQDVQVRSKL